MLKLNHEINDLLKGIKTYQTSGFLPDNIANTYLNTQEKLILAGPKKLVNADKLLPTPLQGQTAEAEAVLE